MKRNRLIATCRRSAFTLIELLIVIAIIAILSGLLLGGVMAVLRKGPEATTRSEILNLSTALQKFKADKGYYPPSQIKLCSNYADYGNTALDKHSKSYLGAIWSNLGNFTGMNWANRTGPGAPVFGNSANATIDFLEGDQCLVFFLQGPPGLGGFSTNGLNPLENPPPPTPPRVRYYEFPASRLVNRAGSPFPSFQDGYGGGPYVYFSSNRRSDGYDSVNLASGMLPVNSLGVSPYIAQMSPLKFQNSSSFQLISAGPDGIRWQAPWTPPAPTTGGFGAGGLWPGAMTAIGTDDVSNFHSTALGIP